MQNISLRSHVGADGKLHLNIPTALTRNTPPPTYEEAKKWFEDGNGYFDNLCEQEKQQIVSKKDLPLGL